MKEKYKIVDFLTAVVLSLYPITFLYSQNFDSIKLSMLIIPLLITILLSTLIFCIICLISIKFVSITNVKIIVPIIVYFLLFYNLIRTTILASDSKLNILGGHRFLLPISVIFLLYLFFKIGILKRQNTKRSLFLYFMLFLNLIPIVNILLSIYKISLATYYFNPEKHEVFKIDKEYPNIYYIVLDGYTSNQNLKEILGYDNSNFSNKLEKLGFSIQKNAFSNYDKTIFSLASTLNLNYINQIKSSNLNLSDIGLYLSNNEVSEILKSYGYDYYIFDLGYGQKIKYSKNEILVKTLSEGLQSNMISSPDNDFFVYFVNNSIFSFLPDKYSDFTNEGHALKIKNFFKLLPVIASKKGNKFIFAHVISPHPPFLFDANGNYSYHVSVDKNHWEEPYYLEQLKYINGATLKAVEEIIKNDKSKNKIIIIQGDHGSRTLNQNANYDNKEEWVKERYGILNAIYIGDNDANKSKTISNWEYSSVNTFRIILNNYFEKDLPILPDKKYFSDGEKQPYVFRRIKESINH